MLGHIPKYMAFCAVVRGKQSVLSAAGVERKLLLRAGKQQPVKAWKAENVLDGETWGGDVGKKAQCMSYLLQAAFWQGVLKKI